MRYKKKLLFAVFLLSLTQTFAQKHNANSIIDLIDYDYFQRNLEFLSADNMQGRNTGSEGYTKAADFVADEYKAMNLTPIGDNDTYFQSVPLLKRYLDKSSVKISVNNNSNTIHGIYGENISLMIKPESSQVSESQKMVFVGYGNIIPKENINDYEGIDVKGKTVLVVMGGPNSINHSSFWNPFAKVSNAVSNGASGVIIFFPNKLMQNMIFEKMHGFISGPVVSLADTSLGEPLIEFDLKIAALAKRDLIKNIFKINSLKLNRELKRISKGYNASKQLDTDINISYSVNEDNFYCKNVIGLLPGSDEVLKDEFVVVGAHLDHVGIGNPIKRDSIYNGMWDNATGAAAILTMAKTYSLLDEKPKRSVIFVCYTGEEKGLLGSTYYVHKAKILQTNIVANVNLDMLGGLFETTDIIPLGYSHSNLFEAVDFAAKELNLIIDDNKQEENEYLMRSDQASFIEQGIPALNIANGYTAVNPKIDGKKEIDKWMEKYYHSPFDDLNQDYSKETYKIALKYNFLTTFFITNRMEEIKWNEDSWIYKKYILNE